eukprot:SAG31_NODE_15975_length_728_cov_7.302067_2_plen_67_part_00
MKRHTSDGAQPDWIAEHRELALGRPVDSRGAGSSGGGVALELAQPKLGPAVTCMGYSAYGRTGLVS